MAESPELNTRDPTYENNDNLMKNISNYIKKLRVKYDEEIFQEVEINVYQPVLDIFASIPEGISQLFISIKNPAPSTLIGILCMLKGCSIKALNSSSRKDIQLPVKSVKKLFDYTITNPHAVNDFTLTLANLVRLISCFCASEAQILSLCESGLYEFVSICNIIVTNDPRKDLPKSAQSEIATLLCEIYMRLRTHISKNPRDPLIVQYQPQRKSTKRPLAVLNSEEEPSLALIPPESPRKVTPNKTFLQHALRFLENDAFLEKVCYGLREFDFNSVELFSVAHALNQLLNLPFTKKFVEVHSIQYFMLKKIVSFKENAEKHLIGPEGLNSSILLKGLVLSEEEKLSRSCVHTMYEMITLFSHILKAHDAVPDPQFHQTVLKSACFESFAYVLEQLVKHLKMEKLGKSFYLLEGFVPVLVQLMRCPEYAEKFKDVGIAPHFEALVKMNPKGLLDGNHQVFIISNVFASSAQALMFLWRAGVPSSPLLFHPIWHWIEKCLEKGCKDAHSSSFVCFGDSFMHLYPSSRGNCDRAGKTGPPLDCAIRLINAASRHTSSKVLKLWCRGVRIVASIGDNSGEHLDVQTLLQTLQNPRIIDAAVRAEIISSLQLIIPPNQQMRLRKFFSFVAPGKALDTRTSSTTKPADPRQATTRPADPRQAARSAPPTQPTRHDPRRARPSDPRQSQRENGQMTRTEDRSMKLDPRQDPRVQRRAVQRPKTSVRPTDPRRHSR